MKKFFGEFKKFITRGNVLDMSVGVIVGGAFTAIVNGLSNNILKPVINFILALIFKKDSLSEMYTFLGDPVYKNVLDENGIAIGTEVDLANSIYIDWGSFINAIINFILTAFVLFIIVKFMNNLKDTNDKLRSKAKKVRHKELRKMKAEGVNIKDLDEIKAYIEAREREKSEAEALAAEEAAKKAQAEREANPTAEDLLKQIVALLESKN